MFMKVVHNGLSIYRSIIALPFPHFNLLHYFNNKLGKKTKVLTKLRIDIHARSYSSRVLYCPCFYNLLQGLIFKDYLLL